MSGPPTAHAQNDRIEAVLASTWQVHSPERFVSFCFEACIVPPCCLHAWHYSTQLCSLLARTCIQTVAVGEFHDICSASNVRDMTPASFKSYAAYSEV